MWLKRILLTICLVVAALVGSAMWGFNSVSGELDEYAILTRDFNELSRRTEELERECARLNAERLSLASRDPEYLERIIWQEISKVRPSDVVVKFEN